MWYGSQENVHATIKTRMVGFIDMDRIIVTGLGVSSTSGKNYLGLIKHKHFKFDILSRLFFIFI